MTCLIFVKIVTKRSLSLAPFEPLSYDCENMNSGLQARKLWIMLAIGDIAALFLTTVIGFGSHGSLGSAGTRFFTTFIPLVVGWFALAPLIGLFDLRTVREYKQLWRPVYVSLISAPLAGWLRGVMLNAPVLPLFVLILGLSTAMVMLAWRLAALFFLNREK